MATKKTPVKVNKTTKTAVKSPAAPKASPAKVPSVKAKTAPAKTAKVEAVKVPLTKVQVTPTADKPAPVLSHDTPGHEIMSHAAAEQDVKVLHPTNLSVPVPVIVKPAKAPEPKPEVVEEPVVEVAPASPQERAEAAYQAVIDAAQGVVEAAAAFEAALAEVKAADPDGGAPSNPMQHRLRGVRSLESANRSTLAMVASGQI